MMTGFLACWLFLPACLAQNQAGPPTPESRAIAFLAREVPRWPRQKSCYSCHNNGDAARALYLAVRAGFAVPETALTETNRWLAEPARWDHNGGEGARSDKRLARLVFTATLATAADVGSVKEPAARALAAARLADDQGPDGSWPLEGEDSVSSPATYGRALATFMARQALASIQPERFQAAIARADRWLSNQEIATVTDASVSLLACANVQSPAAAARRGRGLALLRRGQGDDGGWGPRALSPSESFDTALALLALAACPSSDRVDRMIARGRAFLIGEQLNDGSWVETTRPPGNVSYAQRISTCGWATMALLATREREHERSTPRRTDSKRQ
ncbi:MAG: hypothetical protein ACLQIB_10950 [Isosphaeraceae bacterium]